jgi:hypothetical protein
MRTDPVFPVFTVRNVSNSDVNLLGKVKIRPGEITDLYDRLEYKEYGSLTNAILRELEAPAGEIYLLWKVHRKIEVIDFVNPSYQGDGLIADTIQTANSYFEGAILGFEDGGLKWLAGGAVIGVSDVSASAPLLSTGGVTPNISIQNSGATAGTYGNGTNVSRIAISEKGIITSASNEPISFPTTLPPSGSAGGDLSGSYPSPTLTTTGVVANTYGDATNSVRLTVDSKGRVTSATTNPISFPTSLPPSGSAGGDLTGTYPAPTLTTTGVIANTYGSSTSVPQFTVDAKGRLTNVSNVAIALPNGGLTPKLGNVLLVDAVNGNDATGTVNGPPFLTIEAAISHINTNSLTGVTVWIMPGTYTLASATTGLTIPANCSLRGMSLQTTRIVMNAVNPGSTVTLLTMGENSRVEDLSLTLNSANATTDLVGIALTGTTSVTSKLRTSVLTVDNSGVAVGSTTNVYGVLSNGTGVLNAATFSFNCLKGSTINVKSNGAGDKFGIYQPSTGAGNQLSTRDLNIYVAAPTTSTSTGLYVGVYTENSGSQIQMRSTSVAGSPYPAVQLKLPVVVTTSSTALTGLYTLQGVTLAAGDRVLATGQASPIDNGIWVVASGAWTRAGDMAAGTQALGAYTFCNDGTFAHTGWECTTTGLVGTAALTWVQRYAGGDILQSSPQAGNGTNGIQLGPGTDLVTKTACTHPFTTYVTPTTIQFCVRGNIDSGTHYLWPGTLVNTMDLDEVFYRFQQKSVLHGMFINLRTAGGIGKELTITINKSTTGVGGTGVATLMRATISGTATSATSYIRSVDFAQFDFLSVRVDCTVGSSAADLVVELDLF